MTPTELAVSLQKALVALGDLDLEKTSLRDTQALLRAIQALNDNPTYRQMLVNVIWGESNAV